MSLGRQGGAGRARWVTQMMASALTLMTAGCGDDGGGGEGDNGGPSPEGTVFVDGGAPIGGNGSEQRPFRDLASALAAPNVDRIIVRPGTYLTPSAQTFTTTLAIEGDSADEVIFIPEGDGAPQWQVDGQLSLTGATLFTGMSLNGSGEVSLGELVIATDGVALSVEGLAALNIDAATINNSAGVVLRNASARISDTVIGGTTGTALEIEGGDITLNTVTIENTLQVGEETSNALLATGATLTMESCTVSDSADRGVVFETGTSATLTATTLTSSGRGLLTLNNGATATATELSASGSNICLFVTTGATLSIDQATVSNCSAGGLFVNADPAGSGAEAPLTTANLNDVTFEDCSGGHISMLGERSIGTIENSRFLRANESCISLASSTEQVIIKNNVIEGCVSGGVSALNVSGAEINGNEISAVTADPTFTDVAHGVSAVDSQLTVIDNNIHDCDKLGVSLLRSSAEVRGNTLNALGDAGISAVDPSTFERSLITDNTISETRAAGIALFTVEADVSNNIISDVAFDPTVGLGEGVAFVLGADVNVQGNTIERCANNGILFSEAVTGRIDGNTLRQNGNFGIFEFCGEVTDVTLGENTFEDNTSGEAQVCE